MWTIKANKEVILSAGSLNSAQLLMLSGIGPKWHLDQLGIPTIADLPVGENLQDHYGTGALAFTVEKPVTLVQSRYENIPSVLKYAMFGSGPLTVLGGVEGLAWIPTKYENRSKVRKNIYRVSQQVLDIKITKVEKFVKFQIFLQFDEFFREFEIFFEKVSLQNLLEHPVKVVFFCIF